MCNHILYVSHTDTLQHDLDCLSAILAITQLPKNQYDRKNNFEQDKSLSSQAIKCLKLWYKNTDFRALDILQEKGFVDDSQRAKYEHYNYFIP